MKRPGGDWPSIEATVRRVLDRLDWGALGEIYFHWGGEQFWHERQPLVATLGGALLRGLLPRVPRGGASLWVGAGVAELPIVLGEALLHDRTVVAANLRARECEVINQGLAAELPDCALRYVAIDAREAAPERRFDHLGCISVFTDPETWPVLSDVAYGRMPPVQLPVEQFVAERDAARTLANALFARLARPGLVTTSAEEVPWFLEAAAAVGAEVDADEQMFETAVVGDPVGWLTIRDAASQPFRTD